MQPKLLNAVLYYTISVVQPRGLSTFCAPQHLRNLQRGLQNHEMRLKYLCVRKTDTKHNYLANFLLQGGNLTNKWRRKQMKKNNYLHFRHYDSAVCNRTAQSLHVQLLMQTLPQHPDESRVSLTVQRFCNSVTKFDILVIELCRKTTGEPRDELQLEHTFTSIVVEVCRRSLKRLYECAACEKRLWISELSWMSKTLHRAGWCTNISCNQVSCMNNISNFFFRTKAKGIGLCIKF